MQRFTPYTMLLICGLLLAGCGSDDDSGTNGGGTTPPKRLVANTTAATPTMSSPAEATWNGVASVKVDIQQGMPPATPKPGDLLSLSDSAQVKAIVKADTLYLQIQWIDNTHSIWPGYYYVSTISPTLVFAKSAINNEEDRMMAMFTTPAIDWYDVWAWSVVSTGGADLARGYRWMNNALVSDVNTNFPLQEIVMANPNYFSPNDPTYAHQDTSEFHGHLLWLDSALHRANDWIFRTPTDSIPWSATGGWAVDQRIPGVLLDPGAVANTRTATDSRYDIEAVASYDSTTSTYLLVMARELSGFAADDLDLAALDSVQVTLLAFDNFTSMTEGTNKRGVSQPFWIILP